jgi:hypothetical protein
MEAWLKLGCVKPTIDDLTIGLTWTGADLFGELAVQIAPCGESAGRAGALRGLR